MITTEELNSILVKHKADSWFSGVECLSGWNDLIFDCHKRLLEIDENYKVAQIKEKFGGLRFYFDSCKVPSAWGEMRKIVDDFEARSLSVCEMCGGSGSKVVLSNWIKTMCDDCYTKTAEKGQTIRRNKIRG